MNIPEVRPLNQHERENLEGQYDRLREMLAELDEVMSIIDAGQAEARLSMMVHKFPGSLQAYVLAREELERWKSAKSMAIERARNIKALLGKY